MMRCDAMWCDVMWCDVVRCDVAQCCLVYVSMREVFRDLVWDGISQVVWCCSQMGYDVYHVDLRLWRGRKEKRRHT